VVQDAIPEFQMIDADQMPRRYQRLLQDLAATPLRPRRERINPRVIKRKQSKFDVTWPEHWHWSKLTSPFRTVVSITTEMRAHRDRPARLLHPSKSSVWSRLPEPMDAGEVAA
jgi:hypothetical protein